MVRHGMDVGLSEVWRHCNALVSLHITNCVGPVTDAMTQWLDGCTRVERLAELRVQGGCVGLTDRGLATLLDR